MSAPSPPRPPRPAPARSLRRSVAALVFLYLVAFAVAVLTGVTCQGDAPWRGRGGATPESAPGDGGGR